MKFLMGLNDSYSSICSQIFLSDPLPPINEVFSLVIQEEKQREINLHLSSTFDTTAFFTRAGDTRPRGKGYIQHPKKERPICSHCGIQGHTVDKCYKIHGFAPGYKTYQSRLPHNSTGSSFHSPNLFRKSSCICQ